MKRIVAFLSLFFFLVVPAGYTFGFATSDQDCSKCHSLNVADATELFKDFQGVKVLEVRQSPLKGLWEVDIDAGGRKHVLYVDYSKKFFMQGALITLKEKRNFTQERQEELNKIVLSKDDLSRIPIGDALLMGNKEAKHKIIVFSDPD